MLAHMTAGEDADAAAPMKHVFEVQWKEIVIEKITDEDDNTIKKKLGAGSSGKVYAGVFRNTSVAVKSILLTTDKAEADFIAECSVLSRLRHPNICDFFGAAIKGSQGRMAIERLNCTLLVAVHRPEEGGRLPLSADERMRITAEVRRRLGPGGKRFLQEERGKDADSMVLEPGFSRCCICFTCNSELHSFF